MPTPYGSRGGVAFGPHELRVLGGALAIALQSDPAPDQAREYLRLAQAVDETIREGARLRSFVRAELARYRAALPGAAAGYLDQLEAALDAGYLPVPADLSALRTLAARPVGGRERARRKALLRRVEAARIPRVRRPHDERPGSRVPAVRPSAARVPGVRPSAARSARDAALGGSSVPGVPRVRDCGDLGHRRDLAVRIPAVRASEEGEQGDDGPEPSPQRQGKPSPGPAKPGPAKRPGSPQPAAPSRPVPTPAEVFPPRRRQSPSTPPPTPPSEPPPAEPPAETEPEQSGPGGRPGPAARGLAVPA
ncbi:hypothetical protein [Streptomyces spirodelae]|uniref:hypothetical protein n=1 Tax=Streptomyces spirodelae TaxID=2812904 RepID=UPI001E381733|nr:hypothetical protein [Streptomyces spirodelae]